MITSSAGCAKMLRGAPRHRVKMLAVMQAIKDLDTLVYAAMDGAALAAKLEAIRKSVYRSDTTPAIFAEAAE